MDPVVGRFLSNDPVGFATGGVDYFNRYAYTANDPVNATDPDGRKSCPAGESCPDIQPSPTAVRNAAINAIADAPVNRGADEQGAVVTTSDATGEITEVITGNAAGQGSSGDFNFKYRPYVGSSTAATSHSHGKSDNRSVFANRGRTDRKNKFPSSGDLTETLNQTNAPIFTKGTDGTITETFRIGNTDIIVPWVEGSGGPLTTSDLPGDIQRDTIVISPSEFEDRFGQ